jgi:hypothetical protein
VFEYQEEGDQGQASQGKPSIWLISESYHNTMHYFYSYSYYYALFSYIANYP